jgi:hypothetical protein
LGPGALPAHAGGAAEAWEPPAGAGHEPGECTQGVWEVLAALPRLARLCLDVPFDYHSDMPAGTRPLGALTHLAVATHPTMTRPDREREVEVPFMQVRGKPRLVCARCSSGSLPAHHLT